MNRRRLRILMRRALHTSDSPRRTAAAFSIGVFLGFSPFLGLHTLLALGLAFLLRLNRLAVIGGTLTLNPWTIVPIYGGGTALGYWLLGRGGEPHPDLPLEQLEVMRPGAFVELFEALRPMLAPFVVGNLTLAALAAAVAFPVGLLAVTRYRELRRLRRQRRAAQIASVQ